MAAVLDKLRAWATGEQAARAIPALDGAYAPNNALDGLDAIDIDAPDDFCAGPEGSLLVASGNRLLRLGPDGGETSVISSFAAPITALARLPDGSVAVGTHGAGLAVIDGADGREIARLGRIEGAGQGDITAIAGDQRGDIYLAIGSTRHGAGDWVWDLMENNRHGRLLRWRAGVDNAELLLDGLAYPNGLAVEPGGEGLLVTTAWDHGLSRVNPAATARRAFLETLIPNMPGYPARVAPAAGGGYWLAFFALRTQLVELVLREDAFRKEMMRCVDPALWIRPALATSGSHLEPLQGGGIKKLGIRKPWAPPRSYGLVLRLDEALEPVASLHSRVDGSRHGITAAREIGQRLVLAGKGCNAVLFADPAGAAE